MCTNVGHNKHTKIHFLINISGTLLTCVYKENKNSLLLANACLLFNVTFVHAISGVDIKNSIFRVCNKFIFTCKRSFHTISGTLYNFVNGFPTLFCVVFGKGKYSAVSRQVVL